MKLLAFVIYEDTAAFPQTAIPEKDAPYIFSDAQTEQITVAMHNAAALSFQKKNKAAEDTGNWSGH